MADALQTAYKIVLQLQEKGVSAITKLVEKLANAWKSVSGAFDKFSKSMAGQLAIGNLVSKGVEFVIGKFHELARRAWESAEAFEDASDRIQGSVLALADFKAGTTEMEKVDHATKVANITLERLEETALRTATAPGKIQAAFSALDPTLKGLGKSQLDVLKLTDATAAASKVMGEDASASANLVSRAIETGQLSSRTGFGRRLKAMTQINDKMKPEERLKRLQAALEKLGGPVAAVAQGTGDAAMRWQIIGDKILRGLVMPLYEKVGEITQQIVDYLTGGENRLNGIVAAVRNWAFEALNVAEGLFEAGKAIIQAVVWATNLKAIFDVLWKVASFVWKYVDLAATGIKAAMEFVKVLSGEEEGMGKLLAFSKAIEIKWLEIGIQILKIARAIGDMAVPDWLEDKIPGLGKAKGFFDELEAGMKSDVDVMTKQLRRLEKQSGLEGLTEGTRKMADIEAGIGLDKAAQDAILAATKGLKIQQNIGEINVNQDFRDQDPDRVLVEFVGGLERLGEAALQSNVGGLSTAFEG